MSLDLIEIGFCTQPHGIKGGFSFNLYSGDDSILDMEMSIRLVPRDQRSNLPAEGKDFVVSTITYGHKVIAYLEGVADRNQVEAMLPFTIYINRDLFPETEEDEYYLVDLIDADVYDQKSGEKIGILKDVYSNGMQDILVVASFDYGLLEILNIPGFVHEIDIDANRIVVSIPEVLSERE